MQASAYALSSSMDALLRPTALSSIAVHCCLCCRSCRLADRLLPVNAWANQCVGA